MASLRPFGNFQNVPSTSFASTSRAKQPAPRPAPLDLPALQGASRVVQEVLIKDAQIIPDLGELLTIRMLWSIVRTYSNTESLLSWRTVIRIIYCISRGLSCAISEEKTYRYTTCTMGALPMYVLSYPFPYSLIEKVFSIQVPMSYGYHNRNWACLDSFGP